MCFVLHSRLRSKQALAVMTKVFTVCRHTLTRPSRTAILHYRRLEGIQICRSNPMACCRQHERISPRGADVLERKKTGYERCFVDNAMQTSGLKDEKTIVRPAACSKTLSRTMLTKRSIRIERSSISHSSVSNSIGCSNVLVSSVIMCHERNQ